MTPATHAAFMNTFHGRFVTTLSRLTTLRLPQARTLCFSPSKYTNSNFKPAIVRFTTMTGTGENAWVGEKGAGAFDLRSKDGSLPLSLSLSLLVRGSLNIFFLLINMYPGDTMTTPTAAMLDAIKTCTLRDDVFGEDRSTNDLEAHVAALTGKEAGLFVLSGTMGNQLALRTHLTQPPHGVLCDHRSHIVEYEAGGYVFFPSPSAHVPVLSVFDLD